MRDSSMICIRNTLNVGLIWRLLFFGADMSHHTSYPTSLSGCALR